MTSASGVAGDGCPARCRGYKQWRAVQDQRARYSREDGSVDAEAVLRGQAEDRRRRKMRDALETSRKRSDKIIENLKKRGQGPGARQNPPDAAGAGQ